jgi:hypothetical protein
MAATLVSIVPFPITLPVLGLHPPTHTIPASVDEKPAFLVVHDTFYRTVSANDRQITVDVSAERLAAAMVADYHSKQLGLSADAGPGLFWVPGIATLKSLDPQELANVAKRQRRWFEELVRLGDDDWTRTHIHAMISDLQRFAAKALGVEREWSLNLAEAAASNCPACTLAVPSGAALCPNCKCILDPEKHKKFQFAVG